MTARAALLDAADDLPRTKQRAVHAVVDIRQTVLREWSA